MEKSFYDEIQEIMEVYKDDVIKEIINSVKNQVREAAKKGLRCRIFEYYCADKWKAEYVENFFEKEGFALTIEENEQYIGITVCW